MKILITGSAGFIGASLAVRLLERGEEVIGIDNYNDYYSPKLKEDRSKILKSFLNYTNFKIDIADRNVIKEFFKSHKPKIVVNLAAQAGVRYSIENPFSYIDSNLIGFGNILEGCRYNDVEHLVYASSSSVYGASTLLPYSVKSNVDHPLSLYAATKKANELMAHSYSHLYNLPSTGLRFFTVYGPWDRPDMALHKFAKSIINNETIKIFNYGKHKRDFTYIDDIVDALVRVIDNPAETNIYWNSKKPDPSSSKAPWKIYNIGNNRQINLMDYINELEKALGKKAKKEFIPLQPGDLAETWADVDDFVKQFNFKPNTSIDIGIEKFANWFNSYYGS
jgi:UDP-glucuronate 4-epimerase